MHLRRLTAVPLVAAGFLAGLTAPALADNSIVIVDNGGSLVTRAAVYPGELLTHNGVAYTVETARCGHGTCIITLSPELPASDEGLALVFAIP